MRCFSRFVIALALFAFVSVLDAGADPAFDYTALRNLIRDNHIGRIEDLVKRLPDEFLENYVLLYTSREDTNAASALRPRAILYGSGESGLVISFSGEAGKGGYDAIEISQSNSKTGMLEFRKIGFQNGRAVFEDGIDHPMPKDCLRCHLDSKPIWDDIVSAPGAYGGRAGAMSAREQENFAEFVRRSGADGRYSHLKGLDEKGEAYVARKPAARLGQIMMSQNQKRIAKLILGLPDYASYRFQIGAALSGAPIENESKANFSDFLARTQKALRSWHEANIKLTAAQAGISPTEAQFAMPDAGQEETIARLRMIIEGEMGIDMKTWSTTWRVGSFTDIGWGGVLRNLREQDPELDALITNKFATDCDKALKNP